MIKLNVWERAEGKTNAIIKYCMDNPNDNIGIISNHYGVYENLSFNYGNTELLKSLTSYRGRRFDKIFIDETDKFDKVLYNLRYCTENIEIYRTVYSEIPLCQLVYYRTMYDRGDTLHKVYKYIYNQIYDHQLVSTITNNIILNPEVDLVSYSNQVKYFNGIP